MEIEVEDLYGVIVFRCFYFSGNWIYVPRIECIKWLHFHFSSDDYIAETLL